MDLDELLFGPATFDAYDVFQAVVAGWHGRIESEKSPQVDLPLRLNLKLLKDDAAQRALCNVTHRHAGVERRQQVFLRIREHVRSTEFVRLVDIDGELSRHARSADSEAVDMRSAPRLALPGRCDPPLGLAFRRLVPDALDQTQQVIDIDAVDHPWFRGLSFGKHCKSPLHHSWLYFDGVIGEWRAPTECAGPELR